MFTIQRLTPWGYFLRSPECILNKRVGENSPNLCPTMFSETYTGTNVLPLCTANVNPTISGLIMDDLDHVLIGRLSLVITACFTFFYQAV